MFQAFKSNLRGRGGNGFISSAAARVRPLLLALLLLLPATASAYTVVLKSGRRVEIPDTFVVTALTLTYEAAPGLNVTLLMSTIDIQATERANNEPAGSLLKRAEKKMEPSASGIAPGQKRRELTQADIERARQEREKSEQAYERRRIELGLPSLEESRRRQDEEIKRLGALSEQSRAETAQAEEYWRTRANQLRTEMTSLDAEINYLRSQLASMPDVGAYGGFAFITGPGFFPHRRATTTFPLVTGNPGFMRGVNVTGAQGGAGFAAFGGTGLQAGAQINVGIGRGGFGRRGRISPGVFGPAAALYGVPYSNYDYTIDRAALVNRLRELESARAGLEARWRLLEEEARRAGAQPGWLRP